MLTEVSFHPMSLHGVDQQRECTLLWLLGALISCACQAAAGGPVAADGVRTTRSGAVLDVRDFGAVGDHSTLNTAANRAHERISKPSRRQFPDEDL